MRESNFKTKYNFLQIFSYHRRCNKWDGGGGRKKGKERDGEEGVAKREEKEGEDGLGLKKGWNVGWDGRKEKRLENSSSKSAIFLISTLSFLFAFCLFSKQIQLFQLFFKLRFS